MKAMGGGETRVNGQRTNPRRLLHTGLWRMDRMKPRPHRDALEGGKPPPPPSMVPSLCPATVSLKASASFNGIQWQRQPPPNALATSSNRLCNRS